jgi:hypothetical protein
MLGLMAGDRVDGIIITAGCVSSWATSLSTTIDYINRAEIKHIGSVGQSGAGVSVVLVDNERGTKKT